MLSPSQIQRMLEAGAFHRLIGRILSNGRCDDVAIRGVLQLPRTARRVALALALQRLLELAYGRSAQADGLARRLARLESCPSGGKAPLPTDVSATAVVANALLDWLELAPAARVDATAQLVGRAAARALSVIARAQQPDGSIGGSILVTSIVVWQLGDHERFRRAIRADDLARWLEAQRIVATPDAKRALDYATAA